MMLLYLVFPLFITSTLALDNGLALTPPMGWLTWERYRCIIDCKNYPDDCISERLITRTADLMVREGFLDAGYEYVGIDDCWLERNRSPEGLLVPDRERFPNGMKYIADYIHDRGLKFALYEDYGDLTCAGYPGVLNHEQRDIETFVGWDVDYIKLDGCYISPEMMDIGYPSFGKLLNESGRHIVYSCSWPAYQEDYKKKEIKVDYKAISENCNLWRNWGDIDDNWHSVSAIIDWFGDNQDRFAKFAGPGQWNDPDMLVIGNYGLTYDQSRIQMAIWAIMAAPLMMSVDLQTLRPEYKEILLNRKIIAVNQDPMGRQGLRVYKNKNTKKEIWRRELHDGGFALAFLDRSMDVYPKPHTFTFDQMGIPQGDYIVEDLYLDQDEFIMKRNDKLVLRINPTGVKMFKFKPISDSIEEDSSSQINVDQDNHLIAAAV